MKKFIIISILAALFFGMFTSCETPEDDTSQLYINWDTVYDRQHAPNATKYVDPGYQLQAEDLPELSDKAHTFLGWKDGNSDAYVGQIINSDLTLTAKWEERLFTVTFETEHGTAPEPIKFHYEAFFNYTSYPELELECKGYKFLGWSLEKDGDIIPLFFNIENDITLYAVWKPIEKRFSPNWKTDCLTNTDQIPDPEIFEKITLQTEKYTGPYTNSWEFEESLNPYTVYINDTEIIISANAKDDDEKIIFDDFSRGIFSRFSNVTEIIFPEKIDTSNVTNMDCMFWRCKNLTSLDLSNFDTSNVSDMDEMFFGCNSLISLDVSHFDTSNVTDMNRMFYGCSSLSSLDVSKFNTSNVTDMNEMFYSCSSLTSLDVSHFDTSKVTDMNYMFDNCSSLTSLDVSKFNTACVKDMSYMFNNCSSLTSINLSNFDTANVTNMEYMFSHCKKLTSLDLSKFDTSKVTNMRCMFNNCDSITSLNLSNFNTSNVTDMSYMFNGCIYLLSLDLSKFNTSNVIDMNCMFFKCQNLTSLDISKFDTSNVTDMYKMFEECSSLKILDVSKFNTANVTNMFEMFANCSSLQCIFASETFTTAKVTEGNNVFKNDTKLVGYNGQTPESAENRYELYPTYQENINYRFAQIYSPGNPGYFTDVKNKETILSYLASQQQ